MRMLLLLCLSLLASASPVAAQTPLGLAAPAVVGESGLLEFILPRFSLKTGVRVVADTNGAMVLADAPPGVAVFRGGDTVWHLRISDDPQQVRFRDWLVSDIGRRTVDSFLRDGVAPFSSDVIVAKAAEAPQITGDVALGGRLALAHCGRCHVIGASDAKKGIGSTPSFAVLRSLADWDDRFQQFYVRAPHIAFTQVPGVTAPFDIARPSPIVPVEVTVDEIDAILAFVAAMAAADLGAPLHLQ